MFLPDSGNLSWTFYPCIDWFFRETAFQTTLCSKYDFQVVQIQKLKKKKIKKPITMVKVLRYLTILVVATHAIL